MLKMINCCYKPWELKADAVLLVCLQVCDRLYASPSAEMSANTTSKSFPLFPRLREKKSSTSPPMTREGRHIQVVKNEY